MATYAEKKNGRLTGKFISEFQLHGKPHKKRFDSPAEGDAWVIAEKARLLSGGTTASAVAAQTNAQRGAPKTLSAALKALEGVLWAGLKTRDEQFDRVRRVIKWTSDPMLSGLNQKWADDVLTKLSEGREAGSVNRYICALKPAIAAMRDRGWCRFVPGWELLEENEGRIRVLSPAEEAALVVGLRDRGFPLVARLVELALDTGMRSGELQAIDRVGLRQAANGSWWYDLDQTKSGSPRSVPLTPRALTAVRELLLAGLPPVHTVRWAWDRVKTDMKLDTDPEFTLHACRHTCATRLLEKGFNTRVIQKWLGHKNIKTTERYAHVFDQTLEAAAQALA